MIKLIGKRNKDTYNEIRIDDIMIANIWGKITNIAQSVNNDKQFTICINYTNIFIHDVDEIIINDDVIDNKLIEVAHK